MTLQGSPMQSIDAMAAKDAEAIQAQLRRQLEMQRMSFWNAARLHDDRVGQNVLAAPDCSVLGA